MYFKVHFSNYLVQTLLIGLSLHLMNNYPIGTQTGENNPIIQDITNEIIVNKRSHRITFLHIIKKKITILKIYDKYSIIICDEIK